MKHRPSTAALADGAGVLTLTLLGMTAFSGTFDGIAFLVPAAIGALLGIGSAALVDRLRLPWYAVLLPLLLALLLVGPPVILRGSEVSAVPGPASAGELLRLLVHGWRELLTTLPPVDASGPMTVLPFTLSLLGGAAGLLAALRSWRAHAPMLGPLAAGALAVLLGIGEPGWVVLRALSVLVVVLLWGTVRRRRLVVTSPGGAARRVVVGAALLGLTGGSVVALTPLVDGTSGARTVWRDDIVPPVDLTDTASPLASFRRFRPVSKALSDAELFTVTGLPAGTPVRLATVDAYSGSVWAAGSGIPTNVGARSVTSGFLRVGSRIPVAESGTPVAATVTISPAYAAQPDLAIWLPTAGLTTSVRFSGADAAARSGELRYNPGTGAGLLVGGLAGGDTYRLTGLLPAAAGDTVGRPGPVTAPAEFASATAKLVASASAAAANPLDQVRAVAERLRTTGAYSDGEGTEASILPGHSIGRLRAFLAEPEPAGNDEQYAAALALAAAQVGLPSRIVLAAVPEPDGVVKGSDVRAFVEVQVDAGRWVSLPPEEFVPPRTKHPRPRTTVEEDRTRAAVVPPPNALRPPSSLDGFALDASTSGRQRDAVQEEGWTMPAWLVTALTVAGIPLLLLFGWTLLLVGIKGVRRELRRRGGSPGARIAAAWTEVVDTLRDAGAEVSTRHTRPQVAALAGGAGLREAALLADRLTYGPEGGTDAGATQMWALATRVRHQHHAALTWRDRWRAAVSLRSLVPLLARVGPLRVPSVVHRERVRGAIEGPLSTA